MRIADLARAERIPPKFLELILLGLKNQGILQSRKGKGGGYPLARDPAVRAYATTWSVSNLANVPAVDVEQTAREVASDLTDRFIRAYRAANK